MPPRFPHGSPIALHLTVNQQVRAKCTVKRLQLPAKRVAGGHGAQGWRGELEGIEVTLDRLRSKRDRARHISPTAPVALPMPVFRDQSSV